MDMWKFTLPLLFHTMRVTHAIIWQPIVRLFSVTEVFLSSTSQKGQKEYKFTQILLITFLFAIASK